MRSPAQLAEGEASSASLPTPKAAGRDSGDMDAGSLETDATAVAAYLANAAKTKAEFLGHFVPVSCDSLQVINGEAC